MPLYEYRSERELYEDVIDFIERHATYFPEFQYYKLTEEQKQMLRVVFSRDEDGNWAVNDLSGHL